jgi:hypothetical protein
LNGEWPNSASAGGRGLGAVSERLFAEPEKHAGESGPRALWSAEKIPPMAGQLR